MSDDKPMNAMYGQKVKLDLDIDFNEELLKAFNMDISSMDTAFGWLKTEGFIFILLLTGIYSAILGSNIVLKEENDKTIEYLNSLPIKRSTILKDKIISSIIYIISDFPFLIFNLKSVNKCFFD